MFDERAIRMGLHEKTGCAYSGLTPTEAPVPGSPISHVMNAQNELHRSGPIIAVSCEYIRQRMARRQKNQPTTI